jgi:hypothetical protein
LVSDIVFYIVIILNACSLTSRVKGIAFNETCLSHMQFNRRVNSIFMLHSSLQSKYPIITEDICVDSLTLYLHCLLCANTLPSSPGDTSYTERCLEVIDHLRDVKYPYLDSIRVTFRRTHEIDFLTLFTRNANGRPIWDNALTSFNARFNEKTVVLNLVSMEMMLALSRESEAFSGWQFDNDLCAPSYLLTVPYGGWMTAIIRDPFPYPSVIFDCFGSLSYIHQSQKTIESDNEDNHEPLQLPGRTRYCPRCRLNYMLRLDNDGGLKLAPHFRKHCVISATCTHIKIDGVIMTDHYIKDDILQERIADFDKMVLACNEFVREHGIIEKLRADFPLLSIPDTYGDCLFYSDGSSYKVSNGKRPSSTVDRAQLLYHHYDHLEGILEEDYGMM